MPRFGKRSLRILNQCHEDLQHVAYAVIKDFDFSVIEGHRGEIMQNHYFDKGLSKKRYPEGKHNSEPSEAIHCIPYPINWKDRERMTFFAGMFIQAGRDIGIGIRWGGDWDQDGEVLDNNFDDLTHFELV